MSVSSAAKQARTYLESQNLQMGRSVPESELVAFEKKFNVYLRADFEEYLQQGAGSTGMDSRALIQLHRWEASEELDCIRIYRFKKLAGVYCQFADQSIYCWSYLLHLNDREAGENGVFWYGFNDQIEKAANSFTHFVELWLDRNDSGIVMPFENEQPIETGEKVQMLINSQITTK